MSAVLALCHFCENHGPRVIMTTQAIPENVREHHYYCIPTTSNQYKSSTFSLSKTFLSRMEDEPRCEACVSFADGAGMITNDITAQISYISTQVALNERIYQLVNYGCLHSLSCEIAACSVSATELSPMKLRANKITVSKSTTNWDQQWAEANTEAADGIIMFGDDEHGYTLSHIFRLRDRKARGFLRLFSLILICMDKLLITNNYDFLVTTMSSIVRRLQKKSDTVFGNEECGTSYEMLKGVSASRASFLPAHFLRTKVTKLDLNNPRSLTHITGCPNIFKKLHKYMTGLLRMQTRLCTENLLEGVPTQDMLVMKELKQQSADTDFIDLSNARSWDNMEMLQQIARMLENLPKIDGQSVLDIVLTQLVTGGQIVIKCQDKSVAKRFLLALASLLPLGCIRLSYAEEYRHVFAANLFGCPMETELSPDAVDIVVLLLNVTVSCCIHSKSIREELPACSLSSGECISPPISTSSREDNTDDSLIEMLSAKEVTEFENYIFTLAAYPKCTAPKYDTPTIVKRYKQIILDNDLSFRVLASVIRNTREQWLSRAKLVYQLGHQKESIDLNKILEITKCAEQDGTVLLFFQAGLSKAYKQQIINIINKEISQNE